MRHNAGHSTAQSRAQKFALFQSNCNICHYRTRAILLHFLYVSKTVSSIFQKKGSFLIRTIFMPYKNNIICTHNEIFQAFSVLLFERILFKPVENVSFVCTLNTF